jgi:hypothetical protein
VELSDDPDARLVTQEIPDHFAEDAGCVDQQDAALRDGRAPFSTAAPAWPAGASR